MGLQLLMLHISFSGGRAENLWNRNYFFYFLAETNQITNLKDVKIEEEKNVGNDATKKQRKKDWNVCHKMVSSFYCFTLLFYWFVEKFEL